MRFPRFVKISLLPLVFLFFVGNISKSLAGDKMYWSDRGSNTIKRANLDGTDIETLISGVGQARGVAVDWVHHRLYWADNGNDKIQRSMLDGSQVEDIVTTGLKFPAGVAVDPYGEKVYWADAQENRIQRANLDGSQVEDLVTGLIDPYFVTLDVESGHLYWTDYGTDKVQRSNLDGTNQVDLITTGLSLPRGVDIDKQGQKLYWTDRTQDVIQRSNLDGTNIETLHNFTPSSSAVHGIAIDSQRGEMYWVDNGRVTLEKANLDGSNVVTIFDGPSGELLRPWQIVLDLRYDSVCNGGPTNCNVQSIATAIDAIAIDVANGTQDLANDWNQDGTVSLADRDFYVEFGLNTSFGDSNLDGRFTSADLVKAFTFAEYEDNVAGNSTWTEGDWNGDLDFDSHDFVLAFQRGKYETGGAVVAVPEPSTLWMGVMSGWFLALAALRRY